MVNITRNVTDQQLCSLATDCIEGFGIIVSTNCGWCWFIFVFELRPLSLNVTNDQS